MRTIPLSDIFSLKYGKSLRKDKRVEGSVPVYGSNGLVDYHIEALVKKPTIIVGRKGSIGEVHLVKKPCWPIDTTYYVEPTGNYDYDIDWLYRLLKTLRLQELNRSAAIPGLNRNDVYRISVSLPELDDQKRIAHLLGKVEGLITQRKRNLQQLDDLLKSVFLEMFGDPVRNEMEWDKPALRKFGKVLTGNTPPRKDPANYSSKYIEWIKTDNISADSVFVTQAAEYLSEAGANKARIVKRGALVVACIAGSLESIGRAALTNRSISFNQQINAIQPNKDVNCFYLYTLFKISRGYIQGHASKGMKKILSKGVFQEITMIKPPIDLQNQFAIIVEKVESIKARYHQSLTDLESLYGALSQKAFKGELNLSSVPVEPFVDSPGTQSRPEEDQEKEAMDGDIIRRTLDQVLGSILESGPITPNQLINRVQEEMEGHLGVDEDIPPFGAGEYESVKKWLFHELEQGRIEQVFDDTQNCILLSKTEENKP